MSIRRAVKLLEMAGMNVDEARQALVEKTVPVSISMRAIEIAGIEMRKLLSPTARSQFRGATTLITQATHLDRPHSIG